MNDADANPIARSRAVPVDAMWAAIGPVTFAAALVVAYRPAFDSVGAVVLAAMPWITVAGMVAAMSGLVVDSSPIVRAAGTAVTLAGWAVLMFDDDRWSIVSFGIYVVCYSVWGERVLVGVTLAGVASAIWIAAWLAADAPPWTAIIPLGVFGVGSAISVSMHHAAQLNQEQGELIAQLRATRADLAESERSKGMLEERARMAGEIHDTLAQGFTSIVLLSRAARRSGVDDGQLAAIESTAQENLDASRRLIDAMRPQELESASLQAAVGRRVAAAASDELTAEFGVVGNPRRLPGAVEVTILRAAQELVANVMTHANARRVEVTLSYLDDSVALDVRDDGVGLAPGLVTDRGSLTGGQGLDALARRAESLGGCLSIDCGADGGAALSLLLPAAGA